MSVSPHVEVVDRFALLPEVLIYDTSISASAVRLYAALHRHGSEVENCCPSLGRLAGLLGTSPRSVRRWLEELERLAGSSGWPGSATLGTARRTATGCTVRPVGREATYRPGVSQMPTPRTQMSAPPDRSVRAGKRAS